VHYPALARIVAAVCAQHGVPYSVQPSLRAAVAGHYRMLRALGST
jgi:linoleoyl-CoA desaturase